MAPIRVFVHTVGPTEVEADRKQGLVCSDGNGTQWSADSHCKPLDSLGHSSFPWQGG